MIAVSIIFSIVGFFLLVISVRGRVVAKGQFCRKCKFDLAGLDIDSTDSKCPECGNEIHQESARRTTLRRRSRVGLAAASLMLIASIATLGVWSSGNASVILGVMPDSIVLQLSDMGMDTALDELVLRVSRVPNPMSPNQINKATEMGLAHQADLLVGFDPRWGEVLYVNIVGGQMSDDQIKQYMLNGVDINLIMRDRVHQGAEQVDCMMRITPGRLNALIGGPTDFMVRAKWVADGVVGEPSRKHSESGAMGAQVRVPSTGRWSNGAPYLIKPTGSGLHGEIGSKVQVYIQYDFVIKEINAQYGTAKAARFEEEKQFDGFVILERVTVEHEVEIIDPSEPIVETIVDPELAGLAINALSIMPIQVMKVLPEPQYQSSVPALAISRLSESLPESIALRVYLRLNDSREIEVGSWVNQSHGGVHGAGIQWRINPKDEDKLAQAQEIVDRLIEQGKADVIVRTDAVLAEPYPEILKVVGVTMIFEDVPVEVVESQSNMWNSGSEKWVKGKLLEDTTDMPDSEQSP